MPNIIANKSDEMNNPLISIVIPIYNMEDRIEKCINSILKQNYKNYEIILIDDGSSDNSLEICKKLENQNSKIKVIHTDNKGSGPARNIGIENSKGDFIYFPDADDYVEPNALSILVNTIENGKYDLIIFGFRSINTQGEVVNIKQYPELTLYGNYIRQSYADYMTIYSKLGIQGAPWNKLFKTSIIKQKHIEFPHLRRHQDEGFIGRYMCHVKRVHFIENILYTYYTNDLNLEWKKYPIDYIDSVIGLNEIRKKTILQWNTEDKATQEIIQREYICNIIKSLELSFSPKMKFNMTQRIKWLKNAIQKSQIKESKIPSILGPYQKMIIYILNNLPIHFLYLSIFMKIKIEKIFRR